MIDAAAPAAVTRGRARATLATCGAAHILHDGLSAALYVLFPVWAQEFGLSLTQVGLLKTAFSGTQAVFQLPAGFLAERWGERAVLTAGTVLTGVGYLLFGLAGGIVALLGVLLLAGAGSAAQHPLASTLVSRAYDMGPRRAALGIYNFTGDLGKVAIPPLLALGVTLVGWRESTAAWGIVGILAALAIFVAFARLGAGSAPLAAPAPRDGTAPGRRKGGSGPGRREGDWGIADPRGFSLLSAIGIVDVAARTAFMTFLPFLLIARGAEVDHVGFALGLVFVGGAAGKFLCGLLAERFGIIRTVVLTELVTGAGIMSLLALSPEAMLAVLPVLGVALNGTSSVLYATIADFARAERQARAFGLFYTITMSAGAVAPLAYGLLSDFAGVAVTMAVIGFAVLLTIPLAWLLGRAMDTA